MIEASVDQQEVQEEEETISTGIDVKIDKDISYKRVLLLSRLLRDLIHTEDLNTTMDTTAKKHGLDQAEVNVINHLAKVIGPFASTKADHPVYTIPMIMLCVHLLSACGYNMFVQSVFPTISAASIHAIDLNQLTLYQITSERFIVPISDSAIMSSINDARDLPDRIFSAFFNMDYIEKCRRRNQ